MTDCVCWHRETVIGRIGLQTRGEAISRLFLPGAALPAECESDARAPDVIARAFDEIDGYLRRRLLAFTVPIAVEGTPFQRRVWAELVKIPYGTTATYGEIARALGQPRAARAVGMANHRNPLPLFIPCHRVIGAGGKLVGFGGGLPLKARLLALEAGSFC